MTRRFLVGSLTVMVLVGFAPIGASAQDDVSRTSWDQPDLQGVWDFRTITPMQRPENQSDKEFLTEEEATDRNQAALDREERLDNRPSRRTEVDPSGNVDRGVDGSPGSYNQFWFDRGTAVIPTNRASLIIDPPNGRTPPLTPEAERKRGALEEARANVGTHEPTLGGWVEDLGSNGLQVRCIVGFNSGPPMTPGGYNNNFQMLQTPDTVVIFNEMVHNARIIPLDGRPHGTLPQYAGDSRGRWDGDTLVVETTHFLRETSFLRGGSSTDLQLTERFTRKSPDILLYQVTVNDPTTWSQPWTFEVPMQLNEHPVYEFACHEGNYGLYNILAGAAVK